MDSASAVEFVIMKSADLEKASRKMHLLGINVEYDGEAFHFDDDVEMTETKWAWVFRSVDRKAAE